MFWRDYPELTKEFRTKEEDILSGDIISLLKKLGNYIKNNKLDQHYLYDLQGATHLLQNILITIQKKRYIEKMSGNELAEYRKEIQRLHFELDTQIKADKELVTKLLDRNTLLENKWYSRVGKILDKIFKRRRQ